VTKQRRRWYGWWSFVTVVSLLILFQLLSSYRSYTTGNYDTFTTDLLFAYVLAMVLAAWLKHRFDSPEATFVFSAGGCLVIAAGQLIAPQPFAIVASGLLAIGTSIAAYYAWQS
jgi:hypothetical protein